MNISIDDMDMPNAPQVMSVEENGMIASTLVEDTAPPVRQPRNVAPPQIAEEPPVRTNMQALHNSIEQANAVVDDGLGMVQSTDAPQNPELVEYTAESVRTRRPRTVAEPVVETVAEPVAETVAEQPVTEAVRTRRPRPAPEPESQRVSIDDMEAVPAQRTRRPAPEQTVNVLDDVIDEPLVEAVAREVVSAPPRTERPAPAPRRERRQAPPSGNSLISRDFIERTKVINSVPREQIEDRLAEIENMFMMRRNATGATHDNLTVMLTMALWDAMGLDQ